jgi:PAT family beta-lactamase induction signal transducer AmpG
MLFGTVIREREGERRLPWSHGESHPVNRAIQVEAWWPLLKGSFVALTVPLSLALVPVLLSRAMPAGAHEAFHPILVTGTTGWSLNDYTRVASTAQLVAGLLGLTLGGFLVDAVGTRRALPVLLLLGAAAIGTMALAKPYWQSDLVVSTYIFGIETIAIFVNIAIIPICMRMCSPAVAATQFTIYMAIANFGRPLGATLAASTAGQGRPELMYGALAGIWTMAAILVVLARFPERGAAYEAAAEVLPQGEGLAPARD